MRAQIESFKGGQYREGLYTQWGATWIRGGRACERACERRAWQRALWAGKMSRGALRAQERTIKVCERMRRAYKGGVRGLQTGRRAGRARRTGREPGGGGYR